MPGLFGRSGQPDPWGNTPKRGSRRGQIGKSVVWVVSAVAAAGVLYYLTHPDDTPTVSVPSASAVKVDLAKPFVGTPAVDWSDGEAGVVVPPAVPLNGFTAQQVTDALTKARQAFITANLDAARLQDHNAEPLAALFAKEVQADIRSEVGYRVRIAPGFTLLPVPPKVNGTLTAEAGAEGEIVVRANFAVAYAFHTDKPGDIQDPMDIVAVQRTDGRYIYRSGAAFTASSQGLWPGESKAYTFSMACGPAKQELLAPAYSERVYTPGSTGDSSQERKQAFDPHAPMSTKDTC